MELFLATLFIVICLLLIVVVLLQKGRGGGLGAAFSGSGSAAFGTRTGDVFTWVTIVLTILFLLLAVGTQLYYRPKAATPSVKSAPPVEAPQEAPASGESGTAPAGAAIPPAPASSPAAPAGEVPAASAPAAPTN